MLRKITPKGFGKQDLNKFANTVITGAQRAIDATAEA